MNLSFPRVPVEIDLGEGPLRTQFRLTAHAALSIREKVGEDKFNAFSDPQKWVELSERERFDVVSAFIWGMLLHAHDDLDYDQLRKNLPAGDEMIAIITSLRKALLRDGQPPRPTKGPRRAAP